MGRLRGVSGHLLCVKGDVDLGENLHRTVSNVKWPGQLLRRLPRERTGK